MNEIEKICKEIQCPHFIVWNFGYGDCISCKLQGESYNIESVADDCPYKVSLINLKNNRMDKLEYIPGDLAFHYIPKTIIKKYVKVYVCSTQNVLSLEDMDGKLYDYIGELYPIPLTPEILEKNGWKKEVMSRGVKNSHLVYTKPDIEEYGYFPIYIEKGIGDEFDVYPFTGNNVCTQIAYIKYVHQLQHLLFGLGLNSEMEV